MRSHDARLAMLEGRSDGAPTLIHWVLDPNGRATACGLTQGESESREHFFSRVSAGRDGVIWVDELDARL